MRANSSIFAQICLVFSLLASTVSHAAEVERPFPANAKTGELGTTTNRQFLIDGDVRLLSAGTQIRDHKNRLVQPQQIVTRLIGAEVPILYTENHQGQIQTIWLLSDEEILKYPLDDELPTVELLNRSARKSVVSPNRTAKPSN